MVPNVGDPGVSLKVGQTYERASGAVSDVLNGGEITVGKSPSKAPSATGHGAAAKSSASGRVDAVRNTAAMDLPARQRGIALLILLAIVGMAVIFALVAGLNKSANDLARARDQKTYAALAQAKAALIA